MLPVESGRDFTVPGITPATFVLTGTSRLGLIRMPESTKLVGIGKLVRKTMHSFPFSLYSPTATMGEDPILSLNTLCMFKAAASLQSPLAPRQAQTASLSKPVFHQSQGEILVEITREECPSGFPRSAGAKAPKSSSYGCDLVIRESMSLGRTKAEPTLLSGLLGRNGQRDVLATKFDVNLQPPAVGTSNLVMTMSCRSTHSSSTYGAVAMHLLPDWLLTSTSLPEQHASSSRHTT